MTDHPARFTGRATGIVIAAALVLAFGLRLTVLAPGWRGASPAPGTTSVHPAAAPGHVECLAEAHRNRDVTGLNPEDIPTLPPDFSFSQVASDNCSPVRWNPCEPIHFVINPTGAPPTGVADVKEAFRRLGKATGMTYVDGGLSDEGPGIRAAYQPDRYGERWAPILVHWVANAGQGDVQVVGAGWPTRVGDLYVSGTLVLDPGSITDKETRAVLSGGFEDGITVGPIGPEGVTWGRIILHELAHITGLGHVREPSELMYPETSDQTGPTAFSKGDRAGIERLGRRAGCMETPTPGPPAGAQAGGAGASRAP